MSTAWKPFLTARRHWRVRPGPIDGCRPRRRLASRLVGATPDAFVYLLRCADGSLYCGWTPDLAARVAKHQAGRASRYTRSRLPVELVWSVQVAGRSAALREEWRIKRLTRTQKLALISCRAGESAS